MTHFLKHLTEETIALKKLLIPPEFVGKCGRVNLTNPVFLEPTVGEALEVELYEDATGFWLRNGWQELVAQYSLSHGHYLVFEYRSFSRFKLVMLGANGLELEFPASGSVNVGPNGNQVVPEAVEEEMAVNTDSVELLGTSLVKDMNNNNNNNGGGGRQQTQLGSCENAKINARKRKIRIGIRAPYYRRIKRKEKRKVDQEAPKAHRVNGSPFGRDKAETSRIPAMAEQEASKIPSGSRRDRPTPKSVDGLFNSQPDFLQVVVKKSSLDKSGLAGDRTRRRSSSSPIPSTLRPLRRPPRRGGRR
ncbi:unnamed protein product [Linum tenue]|uniref:TF-B3 domain-containing protein n=1 Tax=Linum tenue TaxID=586396 RepID=A0AAV0R9B7_9ROSI|nr:unnamed protein product [Linum tenue]